MNRKDQDECELRGIDNEEPERKPCAKCNRSYLTDDLDDHDECYDCSKESAKATARECAISEVCEDCPQHAVMHESGCEDACDPFSDRVAEIMNQWENG